MSPLSLSMRDFLHSRSAVVLLALAFVIAGCGADDDPPGAGLSDAGPVTCKAGEMPLEGGGCQAAGLPPGVTAGLPPDTPCAPGETPLDSGGCQPAGVPPEACGRGFEPDGRGGCSPILPESPCPPGQMAVPGDAQCHEVAPCGTGDYGMIPVEATTQFVNGAYPGSDSDGTLVRPWKRIQEGIDHAGAGAIVAVAAGSYVEDLMIQSRPVRLWGRCPSLVEVVATGTDIAALLILDGRASQSEVHDLAIAGPSVGIATSGASEVTVDRVWIHDTMGRGLEVNDSIAPSSITVSASLVEATKELGVSIKGSQATFQGTVVRTTQQRSDQSFGRGIQIQVGRVAHERSTVTLRTSLVEQNHEVGVNVVGSDVTIEATVVRTTQSNSAGELGFGISVQDDPTAHERSTVTLRTSLVEQNHHVGVSVVASDAIIEGTVVRDTQPASDGTFGRGVWIRDDPTTRERSTATLRTSLVEQNHDIGVSILTSDATIDATVVRDTQPRGDGMLGYGVAIQAGEGAQDRSVVTLRTSRVERNHHVGVLVSGSDATIEATVVRDTQPRSDRTAGFGIGIKAGEDTHDPSKVTLRSSLVEHNHDIGVFVSGSDATIEATAVRGTQPNSDGTGGRGVSIQSHSDTHGRSTVTLHTLLVEQNHEVGVLVSGLDATIEATVVRDTQPSGDGTGGDGIAIQGNPTSQERANVTLRTSLVERNHDVGVLVAGSDATIEAIVVRDTRASRDGTGGDGITIQDDVDTHAPSSVTVRASLVEQNRDVGVLVFESDATIESTLVHGTQTRDDGNFGDGIAVVSDGAPSTATITWTQVESSGRAGVSNFSAAVTLVSSNVQCNRFDLNGEDIVEGQPFTFDGSKGNLCGCEDPEPTCPVLSANLSPPEPISPLRP